MSRAVNMAGRYYGRLYVLRRAGSGTSRRAMWMCLCDCGATSTARGDCLRRGEASSCGCFQRESLARRKPGTTHGKSGSPEWFSWKNMRTRCENPGRPDWGRYGGRGIVVCDRWQDFLNFLSDMGPRPTGTTLDRIDSNGDYEPGNCRWATDIEQQNNKRNNHRIEYAGRTQTITEWARETGLRSDTLRFRLGSGWPIDRALTEKPRAKQAK
jgi:hypothetical protein